MRCWFLVLLLGLHPVTDFLPSAQNSENQSECESDHRQGICCNRSENRLSSVDLPWNDRPLSLFSSKGPQIGNSQESGAPMGLDEGVNVGTYDEKRTSEAASRGNKEEEGNMNEGTGTVHDGQAKFDSFEKWKHLHLCRYLSEQRKQKQSACAQMPTRTNHEMDTFARDENQAANNEHIAEELGRDCLGQGASNNKKFGDVGVVNAQAEASFANHLELKSLKKAFRQRKNFANANCGAKVVATNEQAQNAKEILSENRDGYMLNPCRAKIWFIVELCERIQIESVEIASFELFARVPKRFKVSATEEFDPALMNGDPDLDSSEQQAPNKVPVRWYDLGTFSCPSFTREIHGFNVSSTARQLDEELTAAIENRVTGRKDSETNTLNQIRADEKETVTSSRDYIYDLIRKLREEPYVRYVRFEMLEYEGTEHYCPLSLVRIYGSTLEEVINMHEQVDDSLIDAIVSMPGKRAPEVTTEKLRPGNESRLSVSQHLFTLVEASRQRRVSPRRIGDVNNTSDCVNPMSDVSAFGLLCSYKSAAGGGQPVGRPQVAGNASSERSAQRPASLEVEFASDTATNGTGNGGAGELASETNMTEAQGKVPSPDFGHSSVKRQNGSGKPNKAVSGGAASQPVLVRYGNRLNLLELNTTLYAIYLDQLSEHYNAHMQDLSARLQRLAGELRSQVRRNEEILQFVEQQAMAMAVLQDRLRATEAKLERYSLGGRLLPITICCVSFTCLLTFLLSAALNSHYLFGTPNPTLVDENDVSTYDNTASSISCHAAGLCDTKPTRSDVAAAEVTASCEQLNDSAGATESPECGTILPSGLEAKCENGYRDYGHRPLNLPVDFLKMTAVAH